MNYFKILLSYFTIILVISYLCKADKFGCKEGESFVIKNGKGDCIKNSIKGELCSIGDPGLNGLYYQYPPCSLKFKCVYNSNKTIPSPNGGKLSTFTCI